jgi:hypothetical protein
VNEQSHIDTRSALNACKPSALGPGLEQNVTKLVGQSDHSCEYSEVYLDALLKQSAPAWEGIADADAWLQEIRGATLS